MTEKEFRKLKRRDMLEIMLAQSREIDRLKAALAEAEGKLNDRYLAMKNTGSIAEAALAITDIFHEAQRAADIYIANIERRYPGGNRDENETGQESE